MLLPPVLNNQECSRCYVAKICAQHSVSVETQRHKPEEYFDEYQKIANDATDNIKQYYTRWMNIIQLEGSAHQGFLGKKSLF
jgi:hypothetical protein